MSRIAAKICGLSTVETLDAAIAGGASHVGFVFYPPSPRSLDIGQAAALAARVPARIGRVGVFVDPEPALIDAVLAASAVDILQLHGCDPARAAAFRARTGRPVWAAIAVRTRRDLDAAPPWRDAADRLIYDAKTPAGALPGGMGMRFDWTLLHGFAHPLPWALSGGLDAANVAEAVGTTGARMVDVSSGVERAPGVKDVDKIAAFLQSVATL